MSQMNQRFLLPTRGLFHPSIRALVIITIILAVSQSAAMTPRKSPETGKVRVLYIGEPVGGMGPYRSMDQDPFLDMFPVQATTAWYEIDVIRRSLRIYMPRTYKDLTGKQDIVILSDANRDVFGGGVLKWFSDGVVEEGMGLLMTGGRESFGAYFGMPDWTHTSVGEVLPVESTKNDKGSTAMVRILVPENPFIDSLPWENIGRHGTFFGFNPVGQKNGAQTLAELVPDSGESNPFLVWWDIGKGRTFAMTSDWTPAGANEFLKWEFYPDYASNLMLFIADLKIPSDPIIVHRIRLSLDSYDLKRDFLLSMIEFISKFGANPARVEHMLSEADRQLREIDLMYINYDFEGSLARANTLIGDLDEAIKLAIKLKDQALFWIYMVEWTTLTGTSLAAGVVIWTLMVKKRLYRETGTTRTAR